MGELTTIADKKGWRITTELVGKDPGMDHLGLRINELKGYSIRPNQFNMGISSFKTSFRPNGNKLIPSLPHPFEMKWEFGKIGNRLCWIWKVQTSWTSSCCS